MTAEQLHILQHSLGCDQHGRSEHRRRDEGDGCMGYYRNRYVSDPTPDMVALCAMGFMKDHGCLQLCGDGCQLFSVTPEGEQAMRAESPAPPRVSRSRQRWLLWIKSADAYGDMTFGQWLKRKLYRDRESNEYWGIKS